MRLSLIERLARLGERRFTAGDQRKHRGRRRCGAETLASGRQVENGLAGDKADGGCSVAEVGGDTHLLLSLGGANDRQVWMAKAGASRRERTSCSALPAAGSALIRHGWAA